MEEPRPRRLPTKPDFVLDLTDHRTGQRTARGLDTANKQDAKLITHDYAALLRRLDLISNPLQYIAALVGFHPKAVE